MKKVIILIVLISLSACKQTDNKTNPESTPKTTPVKPKKVDCEIYGRIQGTPEEKAEYLVQHYEEYCSPSLRACVEYNHNIGFEKYDNAIKLYRKNNPNAKPDYYPVAWSNFDTAIKGFESRISYNCYADYLSFDLNADGTYKYKFTNRYSSTIPSFSVPLLKGIEEKYKLEADDWFVFSKGTVSVVIDKDGHTAFRDIILFTVKGNYYDISDDPGKGFNDAIVPSPI